MVLYQGSSCLSILLWSFVMHSAMINAKHNKGIDVNVFHEMMSHCGVDKLQKTADIHGLKLTGKLTICENYALAMAGQKNVKKEWKGSSKIPGERIAPFEIWRCNVLGPDS
jgi:hypothetical protein